MDFLCSSWCVKVWIDIVDLPVKCLVGHRLRRNFDILSHIDPRQFVFIDIRDDPQTSQIGDTIKVRTALDMLSLVNVHVYDRSAARCIQRQRRPRFTVFTNVVNLFRCQPE